MNREPQTLTAAYAFARHQFRPFNRTAVCAISEARNRLDSFRDARANYSEAAAQLDAAKQTHAHDSLEMTQATRRAARALSMVARWRELTNAPAPNHGGGTWQGVDSNGFRVMNGGESGGLYFAHNDTAGGAFRYTQDAADVASLGHTGWYTNPHGESFKDGSGLCLGVIARLAGRGPARFVAGSRMGGHCDDGTFNMRTLYVADSNEESDIEAAAIQAARAADELARIAGERESEYQTAWEAGQEYSHEGETIATARAAARAILSERRELIRANGGGVFGKGWPAMCDAIRSQVSAHCETIRAARERRAELAAGDDSRLGFWAGSERMQAAFVDGGDLVRFPS